MTSNDDLRDLLVQLQASEAEHHGEIRASIAELRVRVDALESDRDQRKGAEKARKPWIATAFAAIGAGVSAAVTWLISGGK